MRNTLLIFAVGIILLSGTSIYSKGAPDKIIMIGDHARYLEITDRETLEKFDPWRGQFIDWTKGPIANPADQNRSYEVLFYMKWPGRQSDYDRGDLKMIYAARYVSGHDGAPGFIYLPGKGEKFYGNNIWTIWRQQDDGKWYRASAAWEAVADRLIRTSSSELHQSSLSAFGWSVAFWAIAACRLLGV